MTKKRITIPRVSVAVNVLSRENRRKTRNQVEILAVYNRKWGAFTLPMTKLRSWEDPNVKSGTGTEEPLDAAIRAAAEWLGVTTTTLPKLLVDIPEFRQSDREGIWKHYQFHVFHLPLGQQMKPVDGEVTEWLTPSDMVDHRRQPISPTARHIMAELRLNHPKLFP